MEIPGIGEKMVDKIYQAVNRFYESGEAAAAAPWKPKRQPRKLPKTAAPKKRRSGHGSRRRSRAPKTAETEAAGKSQTKHRTRNLPPRIPLRPLNRRKRASSEEQQEEKNS